MKFQFKLQQYQTDAVDSVVKVFSGQRHHNRVRYMRDTGVQRHDEQITISLPVDEVEDSADDSDVGNSDGFRNEALELSDGQLLINIRGIQADKV